MAGPPVEPVADDFGNMRQALPASDADCSAMGGAGPAAPSVRRQTARESSASSGRSISIEAEFGCAPCPDQLFLAWL